MSCESSITDLTMEMLDEDCKEQLLSHIKELHEAVVDMKSAFTVAQLQLQSVNNDGHECHSNDSETLKGEIELTKNQCEKQSSDILKLLLSLKGEVSTVKEALQTTQLAQHGLQSSVQTLLMERDHMLDELAKAGAISENLRERLHSRLNGLNFARPSSGSQSTNDNDSGVALLLEKAQAAFQPGSQNVQNFQDFQSFQNFQCLQNFQNRSRDGTNNTNIDNDRDSIPDRLPHVQEYLNNVQMHNQNQIHHQQQHVPNNNSNNDRSQLINNVDGDAESAEEIGHGVVYDSDCSLTLAATKSLSLSNSLSKQCGLELDHEDNNNRIQSEKEAGGIHQRGGIGSGQPGYISDGDFASEDKSTQLSFKEGQRLKVAKELLETERKYCHTLKTIQETFAYPLKNSGVLSMKDINTLFPEEVFSLHEKHCGLLSQLEERIASWKSQPTIGDILERFTNGRGSDVLRLYTSYVNDFPEVLKTFHKLCRSSREFTQFLKSSLEHPTCGGLDLGAFLLSPVQRMPRYILLLKQMIKYTDNSHPDYKNITICLDRLRDYLKRLNDSMEHSFQLVTAQITPQPDDHDQDKGFFGPNRSRSKSNKILFPRASVSSSHSRSSHGSSNGEVDEVLHNHKIRYRRSTSVPRSQVQHQIQHLNEQASKAVFTKDSSESKGKLKCRSKSDWAVCTGNNGVGHHTNDELIGRRCQACNCSQNQIPLPPDHLDDSVPRRYQPKKPFERTLSDSDINSDAEDGSLLMLEEKERKFSTSKSLHDFNNDDDRFDTEWFISNSNLCDGEQRFENNDRGKQGSKDRDTVVRNNVMVRPLTSAHPGRYIARIQRGSESDMNLHLAGVGDHDRGNKISGNKKSSLRTSLKNLFSLKKRKTRTLQISGPILPSRPTITNPIMKASSHTPSPVATLRYNTGRECYQSLPPETNSDSWRKYSMTEECGINKSNSSVPKSNGGLEPASLPPVPAMTTRYIRNIKNPGSKLSNPKLPKTPFMTKYQAQNRSQSQTPQAQRSDERGSPFTDV